MTALKCDMSTSCTAPVTMIDVKGYIYCTEHGLRRRTFQRTRKLRPHELRRLERGEPVARY
jgi:hypothetical protein